MLRITDIQDSLLHLVGWKQSHDVENPIRDDLTKTESGFYFQTKNPLITLQNIQSVIPEDYVLKYPQWNEEKEYAEGAIVRAQTNESINTGTYLSFEAWIAQSANKGAKPGDSEEWKKYSLLSDYSEDITRDGIATMVQRFLTDKILGKETKSLLERRALFNGTANLANKTPNESKIVGFELVNARSMGVTMKIDKIGLQMTGAKGRVRLYIFHSSMPEPYKTIDVEVTSNGGFQWFVVDDLYLPYMGGEFQNAGGSWYVCYDQNDLPEGMQAVNINRDFSQPPCSCNRTEYQAYRLYSKFTEVRPFAITPPNGFVESPYLWDVQKMSTRWTQSFGINIEMSAYCDLTDFVISQRAMFADVLATQVAADVLNLIALNPSVRVNRNQSNVSMMDVLYQRDGNTQGRPTGVLAALDRAYSSVYVDTGGIDRICLGCFNNGVNYSRV